MNRFNRGAALALAPVALAGMAAAAYLLHIRTARRVPAISPESLILPDSRPFDADLHLDGVPNARDLGGYRTADGRRVRRGLVYRSGDLSAATPRDLERLQALDIRLVIDLRHDAEVESAPDRLPAEADYLRLPFNAPGHRLWQVVELIVNLRRLDAVLLRIYSDIALQTGAQGLGDILRLLATDDRALPVLIHCSAGKDRTGLTAAVLLSVLGVPDDVIFADYSLSNRYYAAFLAGTERQVEATARIGIRASDLHPLLLADAATLEAIFSDLRGQFGSIEGYLHERAGIDSDTLDRLGARLLEADTDEP